VPAMVTGRSVPALSETAPMDSTVLEPLAG
jgi:hypothetical protein